MCRQSLPALTPRACQAFDRAAHLAAHHLAPSTAAAYIKHFHAFSAFCASAGLSPLPASTATVCAWLADLADSRSVHPDSIQPYLSALNTVHADCGFDRPARGPQVDNVVAGWRRLHAPDNPRAVIVPLPAEHVSAVLDSVGDPDRCPLHALRDAVWVVFSFVLACRPSTGSACRWSDVSLEDGALQVWLEFEKPRNAAAQRRILCVQCASPPLAALHRALVVFRARVGPRAPRAALFLLRGDPPSGNQAFEAALQRALARAAVCPPPNTAYSPKSLRKGAASAMNAIGVPFTSVCYIGGWSTSSNTLYKHYIDPTVAASPAAYAFFGWLLS